MSSWMSLIPVFHLLLVVLLSGNPGSHIFVAANALECSVGYANIRKTGAGWSCYVQGKNPNGSDRITYVCSTCGRGDHNKPAAKGCINESGKVMNNGGAFNCDVLMDMDDERRDGRQIICNHAEPDGTTGLYYCKSHFRNMQCPPNACKRI